MIFTNGANPNSHSAVWVAMLAYTMSASNEKLAASIVAAPTRRACVPLPSGTTSRSTLVVDTLCTVPPPKEVSLVLRAASAVVRVGAPST